MIWFEDHLNDDELLKKLNEMEDRLDRGEDIDMD